jgi:hypothetical protein
MVELELGEDVADVVLDGLLRDGEAAGDILVTKPLRQQIENLPLPRLELGIRPLAAHCHLGLGKLFDRTGDLAKAAEHLTTAATMYGEMDMGVWLEKAEAELGAPHRNSL